MTDTITAHQYQQLAKPDKRARKARELKFHVAAVEYIEAMIPNCPGFHIPNGERRDAKTGAKLKRMGAKAGVVDYCLPYGCGRTVWFEFKDKDGKPSKKQKEWIENVRKKGHKVAIVEDIDGIRNTFKALGIITREKRVMAESGLSLNRISSASAVDQAKRHKFTMSEHYAKQSGLFIEWKPGERENLIAEAIAEGKVTRVPAWQRAMNNSTIFAMNGAKLSDVFNEARERRQSMMEEWG